MQPHLGARHLHIGQRVLVKVGVLVLVALHHVTAMKKNSEPLARVSCACHGPRANVGDLDLARPYTGTRVRRPRAFVNLSSPASTGLVYGMVHVVAKAVRPGLVYRGSVYGISLSASSRCTVGRQARSRNPFLAAGFTAAPFQEGPAGPRPPKMLPARHGHALSRVCVACNGGCIAHAPAPAGLLASPFLS